MFIFGQALLQPLIGAECENVECALPWLSHDGTNSPAVITRTVLSLESISAERGKKDAIDGHRFFTNVPKISAANMF